MREILLAMAVALSMTVIGPTVAADDIVGASGQCYDDDGSGGGGHLGVTEDGSVTVDGLTDVSEDDPTPSVADAVLALVDGNGDPSESVFCTSTDTRAYIEAHAAGNQVCFDNDIYTDGSCPTRSTDTGNDRRECSGVRDSDCVHYHGDEEIYCTNYLNVGGTEKHRGGPCKHSTL